MNKPSKQELIQFIKDANGLSCKQLSEKYNVKTSSISSWLKSYSIHLSDYNKKPSKPELIQFIKKNNGSSYTQLAEKYNVKISTIKSWLKSYSIKLSDYNNKPSKQKLIQFIKKNNGSSYNQLSEKYNVKRTTINGWFRLYSIKLSDFKEKNKPSKQELIQFIKDNNASSYNQLSEKYNVKTSDISNWLSRYSIKLSDFQEKINKPSKQELIQFIIDNNVSSYNQLSKKYNVKTSAIDYWLQSYSIKLLDFKNETIFYHKDNFLNLSDNPHKSHISIKDLDYDQVVLLIKGENPVVYVETEGAGKTTTPNALIEEYIRKKN